MASSFLNRSWGSSMNEKSPYTSPQQQQQLAAQRACQSQLDVALSVNVLAQSQIEAGNFREACINLLNVESLTDKPLPFQDLNVARLKIRAQLFHNYACVRKCQGKVQNALRYAEKALDLMLQLNQLVELPQCYLNLCGLLSAKGLHSEALKHAFLSLQTVKELLVAHTKGELPAEDAEALATNASLPPGMMNEYLHSAVLDGSMNLNQSVGQPLSVAAKPVVEEEPLNQTLALDPTHPHGAMLTLLHAEIKRDHNRLMQHQPPQALRGPNGGPSLVDINVTAVSIDVGPPSVKNNAELLRSVATPLPPKRMGRLAINYKNLRQEWRLYYVVYKKALAAKYPQSVVPTATLVTPRKTPKPSLSARGRKYEPRHESAALLIQRFARTRLARSFAAARLYAVKLQKMKPEQLINFFVQFCAVRIQTVFRGHRVRKNWPVLRNALLARKKQKIAGLSSLSAGLPPSAPSDAGQTSMRSARAFEITPDHIPLTFPGGIKSGDSSSPVNRKLGTLLAITYHNIAVEQEHLKEWDKYLNSYRISYLTAEDFLGVDQPLSKRLRQRYRQAIRSEHLRKKQEAIYTEPSPRSRRRQRAEMQRVAVSTANLTGRPISKGSNLRPVRGKAGEKFPPLRYSPSPSQSPTYSPSRYRWNDDLSDVPINKGILAAKRAKERQERDYKALRQKFERALFRNWNSSRLDHPIGVQSRRATRTAPTMMLPTSDDPSLLIDPNYPVLSPMYPEEAYALEMTEGDRGMYTARGWHIRQKYTAAGSRAGKGGKRRANQHKGEDNGFDMDADPVRDLREQFGDAYVGSALPYLPDLSSTDGFDALPPPPPTSPSAPALLPSLASATTPTTSTPFKMVTVERILNAAVGPPLQHEDVVAGLRRVRRERGQDSDSDSDE